MSERFDGRTNVVVRHGVRDRATARNRAVPRAPNVVLISLGLTLVALAGCVARSSPSPSPSFTGSGSFSASGIYSYYGPVAVTCDLTDRDRVRVEAHGRQRRPPHADEVVDLVLAFDPTARDPFASSLFDLAIAQLPEREGWMRNSASGVSANGGAHGEMEAAFGPDPLIARFTWRCP